LIIDGNGASVTLTGRGSFVRLRECADLAIRGFEVDYSPLPHIAGRVVATDEAKVTIDLEVLPGYPLFEDASRIATYGGGMVRNGDELIEG